jgi:hypothetical protein
MTLDPQAIEANLSSHTKQDSLLQLFASLCFRPFSSYPIDLAISKTPEIMQHSGVQID